MKRIALLSVHTSPIARPGGKKVGGMNTYVREIAQEMAARGITVDIYTRRTSPNEPAVDTSLGNGVNVIHVNAGPAAPLDPTDIYAHLQQFTAGVIAYTIRNNVAYDLMFSHYWLSGWVAQSLKESWGTPFVQVFHTLGHMKNRIPSVDMPVPDVRIQVETQVVQWADLIIANTPAERAQLLWLYRADRRRVIVSPPGVNRERFPAVSKAEARARLNRPADGNLLLFVGRIEPLKAVDSILEALHLIRQDRPTLLDNTELLIIGGDPNDKTDRDMQQLQQLRRELNLEDVVTFTGAKEQAELAYYYAAATAVVMPSEYESFGMVALEAMATGTPVVATEVGGLAYLVKDGETGFLVPSRSPEDLEGRIISLLADPSLRDRMGQNAANVSRSYAWSVIVDRLLDAFSTLAPRARRSAG